MADLEPRLQDLVVLGGWIVALATIFVGVRLHRGGGWAGLRYAWTGEPPCPSCRVPMQAMPGRVFPARSYQVWVCPRCTNALTTATEGDVPECGACRQRSLLTPVWRLPADAEGEPAVQIHEYCPVCGHQAVVEYPDVEREPKLAVVIQFPGKSSQGPP